MNRTWQFLLGIFWGIATLSPLCAEIFYDNVATTYNTTAPGGLYVNSGWDLQGTHLTFLATPIAPNYFIAAKHPYPASIGHTIDFSSGPNMGSYTTIAVYDDPSADLRIFKISGTFAAWAPLCTNSNEVGKTLVDFGRGIAKGGEVRDPTLNQLRGWYWGGSSVQRWGTNIVSGTASSVNNSGVQLYANFDANSGLPDEVDLGSGDSSGGLFIQDGGVWKLAGINYVVDGYFNFIPSDTGRFSGAIFDVRGLYVGDDAHGWTYYDPNPLVNPNPIPSAFYATRISSQLNWIGSIVPSAIPEPSSLTLLLLAGLLLRRQLRRHG